MPNYDGLYELRFTYSTLPVGFSSMTHQHTIDVKLASSPVIGQAFTSIDTVCRDGTILTLDSVVTTYTNLLVEFFNPTTEFALVDLWKYDSPTSKNAQYVSGFFLNAVGTYASPTQAAQQGTLTYRTLGGGQARIQLMEMVYADNSVDSPPFTKAPVQGLVAYIAGQTHPFVGRDDTYLFAPMKFSVSQNEKLFKKRYRNN